MFFLEVNSSESCVLKCCRWAIPDFNPLIDQQLSIIKDKIIKSWLHANCNHLGDGDLDADNGVVYNTFWEAIHSVTVENARGLVGMLYHLNSSVLHFLYNSIVVCVVWSRLVCIHKC